MSASVVADRETGRWTGIVAVALFAVAVAGALMQPAPLVAGSVAVAVAAAARFASPPDPTLSAERSLSATTVTPGDELDVTVTLHNDGDSTLPDLRVVDGVPDGLRVTAGSPRLGTALRPGTSATVRYTVEASRGTHAFDPVTVLARGYTGAYERELAVEVEESESVTARPRLDASTTVPLRQQATPYTGRLTTDTGGSGLEFHAVRDYRPGDPLSRIDWRRAARTGEFATVQFRRERAASVVLVVDTREEANVGANPDAVGGYSGIARSVTAAAETFASLLGTGDRVGLASFGPLEAWLAPGAGEEHRARAARLFGADPAFDATPADEPFFAWLRLRKLRRQLPGGSQVVLFSPLADDYIAEVARRIEAYGHPVTVVSPDPTDDATTGETLARIERRLRLSRLRRSGIRVVDWGDEPLRTAIVKANRRWGR